MIHLFVDEFKIDHRSGYLNCNKIFNYILINRIKPTEINFNEISFRKLNIEESNWSRLLQADIKYPMIVSKMENPDNLPYRLIDGRHRLFKKLNLGHSKGEFFIINRDIILKFATWTY
jgi:hypothetical protein